MAPKGSTPVASPAADALATSTGTESHSVKAASALLRRFTANVKFLAGDICVFGPKEAEWLQAGNCGNQGRRLQARKNIQADARSVLGSCQGEGFSGSR
jgi:hypothetical protein